MTDRQLFIDLDGVLADFDSSYEANFGFRPNRKPGVPDPPGFWKNINNHETFFRDLPLMHDAPTLWAGAKEFHPNPIVLTGLSFPGADTTHPLAVRCDIQKRAWVAEKLGPEVKVITCPSKNKRDYAKPGDIIIDDWIKYKPLWEEMGGIFILHTSAEKSLLELKEIYASGP